MAKAFIPRVLSANRVGDGRVVFLTADKAGWSEIIADSGVWTSAESEAEALAAARRDEAACLVLDICAVEVEGSGPKLKPIALREMIRAARRPTITPNMPAGFTLDAGVGGRN